MRFLVAKPQIRIEDYPFERPLLHACSGEDWFLGDVRLDAYRKADIKGDIRSLPFKRDSFGSAFADLPWTAAWKANIASSMKELLRVAPVVYCLGPWTYGSSSCLLDEVRVGWQPGVNQALIFARYLRKEA